MELYKINVSLNPDKHYEYFWLCYKNTIYKYMPNNLKKIIEFNSEKMNELQKEKKYGEIYDNIKDFMDTYTNEIIIYCISHENFNIRLLKTNIKRWTTIDKNYIIKSTEYSLLSSLCYYYVKKNLDAQTYNLFLKYIREYFTYCIINHKYLIGCLTLNEYVSINKSMAKLINLSIEHRAISLLNEISKTYNITYFYKNNIDKNKYKCVKDNKLLKLLEQKDLE